MAAPVASTALIPIQKPQEEMLFNPPVQEIQEVSQMCPVYVITMQNLCLGLPFHHNLCNVSVYKW